MTRTLSNQEAGIEPLLRESLRNLAEAFRQATVLRLDFGDRLYRRAIDSLETVNWDQLRAVACVGEATDALVDALDHLDRVERRILDAARSAADHSASPQVSVPIDHPIDHEDMPY